MNILAVGAHPDDIEYGCGGTLLKHVKHGDRVYLYVLTSGGFGETSDTRKKEQEKSAEIMGAKELIWGGYEDTQIPLNQEIIAKIEDVVKRVKPTCTFVLYPEDTHQDHRNLTQAVNSATRYSKNVLFYECPTTQNFSPTVFVDVREVIDEKIELLAAHASQVTKTNIENLTILDGARSNATFRGIQGRVKYAEAFSPLRLFIMG